MNAYNKEIPKEIYDRAKANRDYITEEDKSKVFSISQLCGYGVYSPTVFEKDGKYYCNYYLGSSCD